MTENLTDGRDVAFFGAEMDSPMVGKGDTRCVSPRKPGTVPPKKAKTEG
jgi:hypothetical protein